MSVEIPSYLKLYAPNAQSRGPEQKPESETSLPKLCKAFSRATGWTLKYSDSAANGGRKRSADSDSILEWSAPVTPGVGTAPGHLEIDCESDIQSEARCELEAAKELAEHLAHLINHHTAALDALRHNQAELASHVPTSGRCEPSQLTDRLTAVLRGAAEALHCDAATMYVLNDATTQLNMRACWGLPATRLSDAPRILESATADLESLVGHAVILEDNKLFELWNVPDPEFGAAICVPISGPATVLGTFWLYSTSPRDFTERETNLVEILAGRLAVELERAALLRESSVRPS